MNDLVADISLWKRLQADRERLVAVLRRLLTELATETDLHQRTTTDLAAAAREGWRVIKELGVVDALDTPSERIEHLPRIMAHEPGHTRPTLLYLVVERRLLLEDGGQLESLELTDSTIVRAFGELLERLLNRGLLDAVDVASILRAPGLVLSREKATSPSGSHGSAPAGDPPSSAERS